MAANSKQIEMRKALVSGYLNDDSPTHGDFGASVLAAGYSKISLLTPQAYLLFESAHEFTVRKLI